MTCPECQSVVIEDTVMGDDGQSYICNGCGARWREKNGKILWAAAPKA